MSSLLNKKLNDIEWGEFKLNELFESSNGDFDIQKKHINGVGNSVITAGFKNDGILGKTNVNAKIFDKNTFTIDMFGYIFYRSFNYKMVTHARVFSIKPKFKTLEKHGLFLINSFNFLKKKFGYENMCSWEKIKSEKIKLPIKDGKIDFDFMEIFIAKLETEGISKLENYLLATNLKDNSLTIEEKQVLNYFDNIKGKQFNIGDLFEIKNSKNILSKDIIKNSGKTPYLCASSKNNSINCYISYDKKYLDKGNCIFIGGKTFVVSYQEKDFYSNDSHNLALYLKNEVKRSKLNQLYLATCINKSLGHKYSWGDSISNRKIQKEFIQLPIKNNEIDYKTINILMSAIQKLVIKRNKNIDKRI